MEKAAEQASLTAADKQKAYSEYFNRRSSVRNFSIGEKVFLLIPDSSNKIYARWIGPGDIIEYCPPHSYKVRLQDNSVKHVHVNKIRKFHPRVNAVGVVFESEEDFGTIHGTPQNKEKVGENKIIRQVDVKHLRNGEKEQLRELLTKHIELFTRNVQIAKVDSHKIQLNPNVERKKPYVYRIPETLKDKVDAQIEELISLGLIEESCAEIAHPVVCVNKKDGDIRLCVDYRSLNAVTKVDDFPMENAVQLLHCIGKANVITTIDLLKVYWAIPMEERCRELTSFKTHRAQYQFKVMPFGLRNAAATFQRVINKALADYQSFARAYIDDIAIFSEDWESHLIHLDTVFKKLNELGFTVNIKKCSFAKAQIKYLGHVIGSGKHQPDQEKVRAIENLPTPKTKTQLRSVLGLCNYYRDYVPKFSELVFPLTELTKKGVPDALPWSDIHETAFQDVKKALVNAPVLYTPSYGKPFIIQSDASQIGIGACISQRVDGKIYPIAYASQKLTPTQQVWSTIEREAFAVVWSLKRFETLIFGAEIEFYTDHNPLTFLTKCAPQSSRLQRWAFAIQKYNITVKHCPGAQMSNVDALSRLV